MATWNDLPLELQYEVLAHLLPALDDRQVLEQFFADRPSKQLIQRHFWTFEQEQCRLFVRKIETLVSKGFRQATQGLLEQYVSGLRTYCNGILEDEIRTRKQQLDGWQWTYETADAQSILEEQVDCYDWWKRAMEARRRYLLRVLQHIRGRTASWQSLPRDLRIQIIGHVFQDTCAPLQTSSQSSTTSGIVVFGRTLEQWKVKTAETVLAILWGVPQEVASRFRPRISTIGRLEKDAREVRRQFYALHFVSKRFSTDVCAALRENIPDSYKGECIRHLRQYLRESDVDAFFELRDDVDFDWLQVVKKLDVEVGHFADSLEERGCYELGLDEDEVVESRVQVWWLKGRPGYSPWFSQVKIDGELVPVLR